MRIRVVTVSSISASFQAPRAPLTVRVALLLVTAVVSMLRENMTFQFKFPFSDRGRFAKTGIRRLVSHLA